ncbi:MAG TPA: hypothetical protein VE643_09830 [Nitrososphaeraceae archaeon]|nr:hypothetical protein [Nitrososphaeraceae archaeon]
MQISNQSADNISSIAVAGQSSRKIGFVVTYRDIVSTSRKS